MDRYAEIMLHDDISSDETFDVQCPSCQLLVRLKISDHIIKCKRCGETFYIEDYIDNKIQY